MVRRRGRRRRCSTASRDAEVTVARGVRVPVCPDAVTAAERVHAWGCTCSFDLLVAEKSGDLPEVVVDDEECHEHLSCSDAADSASSGGRNVFVAGGLELLVLGLDGVAGVVVDSHSSLP